MTIDQSRLDLARAVGLLRMKERMKSKGASDVQIAAISEMIAAIPPDERSKAQEAFDFETKNKPPQGPMEKRPAKPPPYQKLGDQGVTKPVPMTITSNDMNQYLSGSAGSSFQKVYSVFTDYENEADPKKKQKLLQTLERRASRWVNEHKGSDRQLDVDRSILLAKLVEQASFEQARSSKREAQKRYMGNVEKAGDAADYTSKDPDERYAFKALTETSKDNVKQKKLDALRNKATTPNQYGLTDAEIAAIRIFTGSDFGYINPATKADPGWLESNKTGDVGKEGGFTRGADDSDMMSEGPVHVGVAMSGLRKLPVHGGDVYRGRAVTADQLDEWMPNGTSPPFGTVSNPALSSASRKRSEAEKYAEKVSPEKPIAVVFVLQNAGGRDITEISVEKKEEEVTILAGTNLQVTSVRAIEVNSIPGFEITAKA
jgi:hypothetical protein